jgi:hypothetical protein
MLDFEDAHNVQLILARQRPVTILSISTIEYLARRRVDLLRCSLSERSGQFDVV